MKFEGMLFCTDLDGTLYTSDKRVSRENLDAMEYFRSEGGIFTFITGRVPLTSGEALSIIRPNAPYGCINGGGIYDPRTDKYLWKLALGEGAMELVRAVDEQLPDIGIQLNTEKCIYFNKDNSAMERFRRVTGVPDIRCHYDEVEEEVLKVVFGHDDPERIDDLRRLLTSHPMAEQFDFIRSEKRLFEILPKGASKGGLLMKMSELLGIDEKKTIAIGDYDNDISMISAAGVGFAVANATEGAKAVADFITVSNNEHAIADAIRMLDDGTVKL